MPRFYNFNQYEIDRQTSFGGSTGYKYGITINGVSYMLKTVKPRHYCSDKDYFPYAEYLSCNILSLIGLNCQKTFIGDFKLPFKNNNRVLAVACENFSPNFEEFIPFYNIANSRYHSVNQPNNKRCELEFIKATIDTQKIFSPKELKDFFWKQFIADAFIGNWDRTTDNWGLLMDRKRKVSICPIFDCAASLCYRILDRDLQNIENRDAFLESYCYKDCKSAVKYQGKEIDYFEFISQNVDADCTKALFELMDSIDLNKILDFIENAPIKDELYKAFCKDFIVARKKLILDKAYSVLSSPMVGV
ncbi:MAG: hypothetical protein MR366_01745 [Succinivibrio sp.]|nr:hypothetical protein [Succinivibrio sp.]